MANSCPVALVEQYANQNQAQPILITRMLVPAKIAESPKPSAVYDWIKSLGLLEWQRAEKLLRE